MEERKTLTIVMKLIKSGSYMAFSILRYRVVERKITCIFIQALQKHGAIMWARVTGAKLTALLMS